MRILSATSLIVLGMALGACSSPEEPPFAVANIEVTAPLPGRGMSAGFMTLTNNTSQDMFVTHVQSDAYETVQIHRSMIEDGVSKMRRIEALDIPAQTSVTLQRGGLHLMLIGAKTVNEPIALDFFAGDDLLATVQVEVQPGRSH